ncbi:ssDNA-binding protein, partial [Escherichia coli]
AGCYVNAVIDIWAQDNNFGKRINASLGGVQFLRDGDAFAGGGVASADDFDDISEGADAEALI